MGWKNWPSWLKGGIIAGIIFIIVLVLSLFIPSLGCNTSKPLPEGEMYENCTPTQLSEILLLPSYIPLNILEIHNDYLALSFAFIFSLIIYFLIGTIIGWIFGKIKLKKKK